MSVKALSFLLTSRLEFCFWPKSNRKKKCIHESLNEKQQQIDLLN